MNRNNHQKQRFRIKPLCAALLFTFAQTVQANPMGGAVAGGQASFATSGNTLTVTNTPGAIINWQSFSIGANETTRFAQQSAASTVLNRVVTNNPSSILGTLSSNGRVYLVNPGGIVFGKGATVDVAGLVATTLNLSDADFLAGRHRYTNPSPTGGGAGEGVREGVMVSNAGNITAHGDGLGGGQIYLIAPNVENTGIITAPNGEILLAAGHSVELVNSNDPNLRVSITAPAGDATNVGKLVAESGSLGLFGTAVRNSGTASADSATMQGGKIVFRAGQRVEAGGVISASGSSGGGVSIIADHSPDPNAPGAVIHTGSIAVNGSTGAGGSVGISADSLLSSGAINVDGATSGGQIAAQAYGRALSTKSAQYTANSAQGQGGDILVSAGVSNYTSGSYSATGTTGGNLTLAGDEIKLAGTQLDASGMNGGGSIHVGGLMHGAAGFGAQGVALANAANVFANGAARFRADAVQSGNGGEVVLWSDRDMRFSGAISAKGGALGGDGGHAEVSGLSSLGYAGVVDLSAVSGANGILLLDPHNITIVAGNGALAAPYQELLDPTPGAGEGFGGAQNLALANGNIVVASPLDSAFGLYSGAVYLFSPAGTLLSTLVGSAAGDKVGSGGITVLSDNLTYWNAMIGSPLWGNGGVTANAGAVTWMNGTTGALAGGGAGGSVSSTNSLVGWAAGDQVGSGGITLLSDNSTFWNAAVRSPLWGSGGVAANARGAVTWMKGATGELSNSTAITRVYGGAVSSTNSLIGSTAGDKVGMVTIHYTSLGVPSSYDVSGINAGSNGNMVVLSNNWNNGGTVADAGAATWMNGATGALAGGAAGGAVSSTNSLVGAAALDRVGTIPYSYGNGTSETIGFEWLSGGNYLVRSGLLGSGGTQASAVGAVTWGSRTAGVTGTVSSVNSLIGFTAGDQLGSGGILHLANGNIVISSPNWTQPAVAGPAQANVGAVTWMNSTTGVTGLVSSANSLTGNAAGDRVGSGGIVLVGATLGNYVVRSPGWGSSGVTNNGKGAVTWGSGTTGVSGQVSSANSIVGSLAGDLVGAGWVDAWTNDPGLVVLPNGNYVVVSSHWTGGMGAVTWGDGNFGTSGVVTGAATPSTGIAPSIVGTVSPDNGNHVGALGIQVQSGGGSNYVVKSPWFDFNGMRDVGAVTWMDGATGKLSSSALQAPVYGGVVDGTNSLIGALAYGNVGAVTALNSGHFLATTPVWGSGAIGGANAIGAVTWINGITGKLSDGSNGGSVSSANSLVGSFAGDMAANSVSITQLNNNGNLIVRSSRWSNGGAAASAGAVTWMNGLTGELSTSTAQVPVYGGVIGPANSLVGAAAADLIGSGGIFQVGNGNALIASPAWSASRGAATWINGATGELFNSTAQAPVYGGAVSSANSIVGSSANDSVGNAVITLANGNYVLNSIWWANGAQANAGAVTWGSGTTGIAGTVSSSNSLVGNSTNDQIGSGGITVLPVNGNYVVRSPSWSNGTQTAAGAVTWGSGTAGVTGAVSPANSLVGSVTGDQVGASGITALTNGNYVVSSSSWNNGALAAVGAVTWGSGTAGITGAVSPANSLVGGTAYDMVGSGGATELSNGNYVVFSPSWNNGAQASAGAITLGSKITGVTGVVSSSNSLVGAATGDSPGSGGIVEVTNNSTFWNYLVKSPSWGGNKGAMTWINGATGELSNSTVQVPVYGGVIGAANSLIGATGDRVADPGGRIRRLANGNAVITTPYWGAGATWSGKGAATWINGANGKLADGSSGGLISAGNSLVGISTGDFVGGIFCDCGYDGGVTALSDGNYIVNSPSWFLSTSLTGAVTWGSGTAGVVGAISSGNSVFAHIADGGINEIGATGSVLAGSGTANSGRGGVYMLGSAQSSGVGPSLFAAYPSVDATIGAGWISSTLSANTNVVLQANNDITQNANAAIASTGTGNLTLQAGRSIYINADIDTGNGNIAMIANDTLADGVITRFRDIGTAQIAVGSGVNLKAGAGAIAMRMLDGGAGGDITWSNAVNVTAGSLALRAVGSIIFDLNSSITAGTTAPLNVVLNADSDGLNGGNIQMFSGSSITSKGGTITLGGGANPLTTAAAGMGVFTSPEASGIYLEGATLDAGAGNISLRGAGVAGTDCFSTVCGAEGIYLANGSRIQTTTGAITLNGTGGAGASLNSGIRLGFNTALSSVGGAISLTGQGGAGSGSDNYGLFIHNAATITSTGTATITLRGTGGAGTVTNRGVYIDGTGTSITSLDGDINITGIGAGSSTDNRGIYLSGGAHITSTGLARVILDGTGSAAGTGWGYGVYIKDLNTLVTSQTGNISITGQGGGSGSDNYGIYLTGNPAVTSTGTATITLRGTGGAGTSNNQGIRLGTNTTISSVDGNISLIGVGGAGTGGANMGIYDHNGARVLATGIGSITLDGRGGSSGLGGSNRGVRIASGASITTNIGGIGITGIGAFDGDGVQILGGSTVRSTLGGVSIDGTSGAGASSDAVLLSGTPAGGVLSAAAGLTIKGTGDVVLDTGSAINVTTGNAGISAANNILFAAGGVLTTQGGSVTLASDSDASGSGAITMLPGSSISSAGGNITMGGGNNLATGYAVGSVDASSTGNCTPGVCGIALLGATTSLNSGGGNISLRGRSFAGGNGAVYVGVWSDATINSGTGTITIDGISQGSGFANAQGVILTGILTSASASASAITVTGSHIGTTNAQSVGLNTYGDNGGGLSSATIQTTNGGGINLTGTGASMGLNLYMPNGSVLSNTGNITLSALSGAGINLTSATLTTGGNVTLDTTGGDITLAGIHANNVSVNAGSGYIYSGSGSGTGITATGTVGLSAAGIGYQSPSWPYTTNYVGVSAGGAVTLTTTGAGSQGNIYLRGDAALALNPITTDATTSQRVDLVQQTSSLTMPVTQTGNDWWLVNAPSGITFLPGSSLTIGSAVFTSSSGITAQGNLSIHASTGDLNFNNGHTPITASGIVNLISDTGYIYLGSIAATNTGLADTTPAISVRAPNGYIDLYNGLTASGSGGISLLAGNSIDLDYNDIYPNLITAAGNINIQSTGGSISSTGSARVTGASVLLDGATGVNTGDLITAATGSATVTSANGPVTLRGVSAATGVSASAGGANSWDGLFNYGRITASAGGITLTSATIFDSFNSRGATPIQASGWVTVTAPNGIRFDTIQSSGVTLISTAAPLVRNAAGGAPDRVTANYLTVTAAGGIDLTTSVSGLQTTNTGAGNTVISNTGALTVNGMSDPGSIQLVNSGSISMIEAMVSGDAGVTIAANGATSDLTLNFSSIVSTTGNQFISAGRDLTLNHGYLTSSTGNQTVTSGQDIIVFPGKITTGGNQTITAGRDMSVIQDGTSYVDTYGTGTQTITVGRDLLVQVNTNSGLEAHIESSNGQTITVGRNLTVQAFDIDQSRIRAWGGDQSITVGGDMLLNAQSDVAQVIAYAGNQTINVGGNLTVQDSGDWATLGSYGAGAIQTINVGGTMAIIAGGAKVESAVTGGSQAITVGSNLAMQGGTLTLISPYTVSSGAALTMSGGAISGAAITNNGTFTWSGGTVLAPVTNNGAFNISAGNFNNTSTFDSAGSVTIGAGAAFTNSGTYNWVSGTLGGAGGFNGGGAFNITGAGAHVLNGPTLNLGSLTLAGTSLSIQSGALNLSGILTLNSGATLINNGAVAAPSLYNYGTLGGSGSITGDVFNDGTVGPGNSPGALTVFGNYTQRPGATLAVELGGTAPGSYDTLTVIANGTATGTATLGGMLSISLVNGYTGSVGDTFPIIRTASLGGTFAALSSPPGSSFNASYLPAGFDLSVASAAAIPPPVLSFIALSSSPPPPDFVPSSADSALNLLLGASPPAAGNEDKLADQIAAEAAAAAPEPLSSATPPMPVCR